MSRSWNRSRKGLLENVARMRQLFPGLVFSRSDGVAAWRGTLQPYPGSTLYTVRIEWLEYLSPEVRVRRPTLPPDAPHRYPDGSLCLYYPRDRSWNPDLYVADTIVPWTAEWLLFYEFWLDTGRWWGPEAPHGDRKEPVAPPA